MNSFQFLLQELVMCLEGAVHGVCYNRMLHKRNPQMPDGVLIFSGMLVYGLILVMNQMAGIRLPGILNTSIMMVLFQLLLWKCCTDRLQTRLFATVLVYVMQALVDILITSLFVLVLGHEGVNFLEDNMLGLLILAVALELILIRPLCRIWNRKKDIRQNGFAIVRTALLVVFLYLLFLCLGFLLVPTAVNLKMLATALGSLAGTGAAIVVCLLAVNKQMKQERLDVQSRRRLQKEQEALYQSLERQERKLSMIRHDHLNILAAASQLLEEQQTGPAEELLNHYLIQLESPVMPVPETEREKENRDECL